MKGAKAIYTNYPSEDFQQLGITGSSKQISKYIANKKVAGKEIEVNV